MAKMKIRQIVSFEDDLLRSMSIISNWLRSSTEDQKRMLQEALGLEKIHWVVVEADLKTLVQAAGMTHSRLSDVLAKTEIDV